MPITTWPHAHLAHAVADVIFLYVAFSLGKM